jgi:hypothetical protein
MNRITARADTRYMNTYEDLPTFTQSQLQESRANDFVRLVACLWDNAAKSFHNAPQILSNEFDRMHAAEAFTRRWPRSLNADIITKSMKLYQKADVNPGSTLEPSWASPLAVIRPLIEAFVDVARSESLIGKLTTASRVPFNVSVPAATGGGTYRWTGQNAPKPVGNMSLQSATLPILKASGLIIVTNELLKLSAPASVATLRRELIRGMSAYLDAQLSDPTVSAVAGVSPASITFGAPSIASAGSSAANALSDIKLLLSTFTTTNPNAESMALLMSPGVAVALAVATNSQTLGPNGGFLFGTPVHTGSIGGRIIALDPGALLVADDGELDVSVSRQATVELNTTATSPVTAASVITSLWQLDLTGLKVDRFINWRMARANSVLYSNVNYT